MTLKWNCLIISIRLSATLACRARFHWLLRAQYGSEAVSLSHNVAWSRISSAVWLLKLVTVYGNVFVLVYYAKRWRAGSVCVRGSFDWQTLQFIISPQKTFHFAGGKKSLSKRLIICFWFFGFFPKRCLRHFVNIFF